MIKIDTLNIGGMLLAVLLPAQAQRCRVFIHVTDCDTGAAITNAQVGMSVDTNIKPGWGWGAGRPNRYGGISDELGMCVLSGKGNGGTAGIYAKKEGYYGSSGYSIRFTNVTGVVWRRWQPWNPAIHVKMKRIEKPIPLHAKNMFRHMMPQEDEPVGFDLLRGDWVAPYGQGMHSDFIITLNRKPEQVVKKTVLNRAYDEVLYDIRLTVQGAGEGDGFIEVPFPVRPGGSSLRMPRHAPPDGYRPAVTKRNYRDSIDSTTRHNVDENMNYFFRVRTVLDKDGRVESALYGKIHGDFQLDHNGAFGFMYYLNPTPNDRNLEFDRDQNLFKNLPPDQRVTMP